MRSLPLWTLVLLVAAQVLPSCSNAQEWPRFRGPNGTGESEATTVPGTWTDDDYNWVTKLPGVGNSSPVLWGEKLFILSADPETATRFVLCIDSQKGTEIWRRDFASQTHHLHTMSSYASSTPAVDRELVFVAWSTPASLTLMALTHAGEIVWQKDLGPWSGQHGFGTSPVLFEDLVILSNSQEDPKKGKPLERLPDSYLMAFDRQTGEERWRIRRATDNVTYSVPAIFQPKAGAAQLVNLSTGSGMYSIDPRTGQELWSTVVFDKRTVSSPVVKGDLIFGSTGSGGGGSYVTGVRSDGQHAEVAFQVKTQAPYVPTVVAKDDLLFLISDAGIACCVDLQSGELHWRNRIGGNYQSSPVRVADKVYCLSIEGEMVVLAASKDYAELGRIPLGEGSRATPAVAGGRMFIRTFSKLMSIGGPKEQQPESANSSN